MTIHSLPVTCGIALLTGPLLAELPSPANTLSLFPAEPGYKITYNGEQGARWSVKNNHLEIRREKPSNDPGIRGGIRITPAIDLNSFPGAANLKIKYRGGDVKQEYHLFAQWYFDQPRGSAGRMITIKGSREWQEVELPIPRRAIGNKTGIVVIKFDPESNFDIASIRMGEKRSISVELGCEPENVMKRLVLKGRTSADEKSVTITLRKADGKTVKRTAATRDGLYEISWDNPPLSVQAYNTITASTASGETSLPLQVFGYRPNYDFAWLKAQGPKIVTADGKEFLPAGIGYARDVIISNQDDAVMSFAKARGLNTIRLPFYTRFFNNNQKEPIDLEEHMRNFIDPVIQAAKRHNMYVILDDHGYFSEKIDEAKARSKQAVSLWDDAGVAEWTKRWRKIAERYKNEPHVLGYELMNEPHDIRPELAREWYTRAIREIRKVDKKHLILVGSADWSHSRSMERTWGPTASTADAPYNNLVFAFHDYPLDNHPWIVKKHVLKFRDTHKVPVMCTEFGATHWDKGETVCREFQAGLLAFCAQSGTGWMVWALGELRDHPRNPYNEVDKVGFGPPREADSCAYSDLWAPVAKVTASSFPEP